MATDSSAARLGGVTRLSLGGPAGPGLAFLFEPHRLALPCWALALDGRGPALLVTLDRHLDLVPPANPQAVPEAAAGLRALDEFARWSLDVRNVDHVLAAMEAGLVEDAIVIARARPVGCLPDSRYRDRRGRSHELVIVPTPDRLADGFAGPAASAESRRAQALLEAAPRVLLDVDLDCFTSPCDADPTAVLPWPGERIREHLLPRGSETFWAAVLGRCVALTVARESAHCGGVLAGDRLFADVAPVLFQELLRTDLP